MLRTAALLAVLLASMPVRADDTDDDVDVATLAAEAGLVFGIPAAYYWKTPSLQKVDWTLHWDWPSWRDKLTLKSIGFDTNPITVNSFRHPLSGVLDYHIARSSGLGVLGSTIFAYANGIAWEYFVEFKEVPSINDMIMNGAAGLAIGEPLYRLWSPLDEIHARVLDKKRRWHRTPYRTITLGAGIADRRFSMNAVRREGVVDADVETIALPARSPGAWSRIYGQLRFDGEQLVATLLESRTSLTGRFARDDAGHAVFYGLGTAFSYRRDRLPERDDHAAFAHLLGPQLQVWRGRMHVDAAAYADFAMIDAFAFGKDRPFPTAPPYLNPLQADGYYDAYGVSAMTRARADLDALGLDLEIAAHRTWQIDGRERGDVTGIASRATTDGMPHGATDTRIYGRGALTIHLGQWGLAVTGTAAYRHGEWHEYERSASEIGVGALVTRDL
jgi:hypothetical protein